jgi:hypothetical protein
VGAATDTAAATMGMVMAYDYQKVQAWLARVPRRKQHALELWLEVLDACPGLRAGMPFHLFPELQTLVSEFRTSSTWERANMLYGLRDIVDEEMAYDIYCYSQQARREDAAHDPELQRILQERTLVIQAPVLPDTCPKCGQPYTHHQHPMKPPGVIISSTCGCSTGETDDAQAQRQRRRGGAAPSR